MNVGNLTLCDLKNCVVFAKYVKNRRKLKIK
jgi:hypothetical protein